LGPFTKITHYIPHIIQLRFLQKYLSHYYQNWATKLYYLHKKTQTLLPCGQNTNSPTKPSYKARCYATPLKALCYMATLKARYYTPPLKPVVTRHPKARCYTPPLKSSLLHGTPKVCCYTALLLRPLLHGNIFTKSQKAQMLFWHLFMKAQ